MISDDDLKYIADVRSDSQIIKEMAKELLERRQTENKIAALMDSQYIAGARF